MNLIDNAMAWEITSEAFDKLLKCFDADQERAAEKYEEMRRTLIRVLGWEGAFSPEELVDEVFNRVAKKLMEGEVIANLGGYCYRTALNLKREASKKPGLDELDPNLPATDSDETLAIEQLAQCQDKCLLELPAEGRGLILEYYQDDGRQRINHRQEMAVRFGLTREALANRAQRLRHKLEQCITACQMKNSAI